MVTEIPSLWWGRTFACPWGPQSVSANSENVARRAFAQASARPTTNSGEGLHTRSESFDSLERGEMSYK